MYLVSSYNLVAGEILSCSHSRALSLSQATRMPSYGREWSSVLPVLQDEIQ